MPFSKAPPAASPTGKQPETPASEAPPGASPAGKQPETVVDKLRGLGKGVAPKRAVPPPEGSPEFKKLFRHGEIFFEETSSVAKYLLVPDEVEDPEQLLRLLLDAGFWGMTPPNLAIYATEARGGFKDYLDPKAWTVDPEQVKQQLQERSVVWGSDPESARQRHESKVQEIAYAVVRAATECGAWILPGNLCNMSGGSQGGIFKYACDDFFTRTGGLAQPPTLLGGMCGEFFRESYSFSEALRTCAPDGTDLEAKRVEIYASIDDSFLADRKWTVEFPTRIDLWEPASEIGQPVRQRVVWPSQEACYKGDATRLGPTRLMACLNPRLSHILVHSKSPAVNRLLNLLPSIVPAVCMVQDAKIGRVPSIFREATSGVQVVVLKNAGVVSTDLALAVEGSGQAGQVTVPDWAKGAGLSNITIFDCVHSSAEDVIAKLTKALSNVSSEDVLELGFAQGETRRLLRAWELHTQYAQASTSQYRLAVFLFTLILAGGLCTQLAAVLFSAALLEDIHPAAHSAVRIACGVLPLVSTFLISVNSRFSPQVKSAFLDAAASRVRGEIYRYRARVGDYAVRSGSSQFAKILARGRGALAPSPGEKGADKASTQEKPERAGDENGRTAGGGAPRAQTVFSRSMDRINTDLAGSDVRLDSLPTPAPAAVRSQIEALYPGVTARLHRAQASSGSGGHGSGGCWGKRGAVDHDYEEDLETAIVGADGGGSLARLLGVRAQSEELEDDGLAAISADDYLLFRLQPLIKLYTRQAESLVFRYKYLYLLIFLSTALSTLLTLLKMEMWIPLVVSASAGFSSIMEFGNVQARILSTNTALLALKNLVVWWEGLSMVQRRLPQNKELLVEGAEAAVEAERGVVLSFFQKRRAAGESGEDASREDGGEEKK